METGFEDVAIVSPLARLQPDNLGTRLFGIALQSGNQKIILSHNKASLVGPRPMNSSNHKVLWVRQAGFPNKKKTVTGIKLQSPLFPSVVTLLCIIWQPAWRTRNFFFLLTKDDLT